MLNNIDKTEELNAGVHTKRWRNWLCIDLVRTLKYVHDDISDFINRFPLKVDFNELKYIGKCHILITPCQWQIYLENRNEFVMKHV